MVVFVLKNSDRTNTLNGFVFQSKANADVWVAQPWAARDGYRVERWEARTSRCGCGAKRGVKLLRRAAE